MSSVGKSVKSWENQSGAVRERSKNTKQSSKVGISRSTDSSLRRSGSMNSSRAKAGAGVVEWEDSAGEMESEDNHAAVGMGMGMMEVDADAQDLAADVLTPSSTLPRDADFFNSFPDDFDDQDLS